jgi:hypothetical protein
MTVIYNYRKLSKSTAEELSQAPWIETTEEDYYDMLGAVPPVRMQAGAFMVGECLTHGEAGAIYEAFVSLKKRYFRRPAPIQSFDPQEFKIQITIQFKL